MTINELNTAKMAALKIQAELEEVDQDNRSAVIWTILIDAEIARTDSTDSTPNMCGPGWCIGMNRLCEFVINKMCTATVSCPYVRQMQPVEQATTQEVQGAVQTLNKYKDVLLHGRTYPLPITEAINTVVSAMTAKTEPCEWCDPLGHCDKAQGRSWTKPKEDTK